jgi:hypothetical protein
MLKNDEVNSFPLWQMEIMFFFKNQCDYSYDGDNGSIFNESALFWSLNKSFMLVLSKLSMVAWLEVSLI